MKVDVETPKLLLLHTPQHALVPATQYDLEKLCRYGVGHVIEAKLWQERSIKQHRLYWVALGIVAENNEVWTRAEVVHRNIKKALGYVETYFDFFGVECEYVQSTGFNAMDQGAFKEYFDQAMELIRLHFKVDIDELLKESRQRLAPQRHFPTTHRSNHEHRRLPAQQH
jgi:hypothetical protein